MHGRTTCNLSSFSLVAVLLRVCGILEVLLKQYSPSLPPSRAPLRTLFHDQTPMLYSSTNML